MSKMRACLAAFTAFLLSALAMPVAAGQQSQEPPARSAAFAFTDRVGGYRFTGEAARVGGVTTANWQKGDFKVSVTARRGATVEVLDESVTASSGGSVAVAVSSTIDKSKGAAAALAAYRTAGRSVIDDAVATGLSRAAAEELFGSLAEGPSTLRVAPGLPTMPAVAAARGPLDDWCVDATYRG